MIIDSSAIIAILFDEPEASFLAALAAADICRLSSASLVEVGLVLRRSGNHPQRLALDEMLRLFAIRIESVTEEQAWRAIDAYDRFGKGAGHAAGLNYGDCFSYALAKETAEPLLFKGGDFSQTDLEAAR